MSRAKTKSSNARPRARIRMNGKTSAGIRPTAAKIVAPAATEAELHALLAQRVRLARAQRGMTRKQLAEQSGISLVYLARVESGAGNISLGLLQKLSLALNLPIAGFLAPEEMHGADFALILEFLKRQRPDQLARIRRSLFEKFARPSNGHAQRIALIGIRGVGKSTLGPLLAERLGMPFVDLDRQIEKEAGLALTGILTLYGQRGYRQLERRCLEQAIVAHPKLVLAAGGGIVTEPATYELLLSSFYTVWLKAKPQVMFARVMAQHDARIGSPQLRGEALDNIARTLAARRHLYELAHAFFDTSEKTPHQTARALLAILSVTGELAKCRVPVVARKMRA
jgi:XRE family aerobic/anaerobic benzoate catabolism transcriptional regulator